MLGCSRIRQWSLAVVGAGGAFALIWIVSGHTYDFVYDWIVAKALLNGVNPHQTIGALADYFGLISDLEIIHPRIPGALLILAPIGLIPFSMEYVAGRLLTVASALVLAWIFARISRTRVWISIALVPLALLLPPFSDVLSVSQTDFLIAGLIGVTLISSRNGDRLVAGIPLGLAVTLKLWAWPLGLALLLGRRWRSGIGVATTFVLLNAFGLAFPHVSLEGTVDALTNVWLVSRDRSVSVSTVLGVSPLLLPALVIVLMTAVALLGRNKSWELLYVYSVPLALMAAPIIWVTYTVSLLVPVAWIVSKRQSPLEI